MEVPYNQVNKFSKLVIDYVNEDKNIKPFINHFPTLENFEKQIIEKQNHPINRVLLREVLKEQNANFTLSKKTKNNISILDFTKKVIKFLVKFYQKWIVIFGKNLPKIKKNGK